MVCKFLYGWLFKRDDGKPAQSIEINVVKFREIGAMKLLFKAILNGVLLLGGMGMLQAASVPSEKERFFTDINSGNYASLSHTITAHPNFMLLQDDNGEYPLWLAISNADAQAVNSMLESPNVRDFINIPSEIGFTALKFAVYYLKDAYKGLVKASGKGAEEHKARKKVTAYESIVVMLVGNDASLGQNNDDDVRVVHERIINMVMKSHKNDVLEQAEVCVSSGGSAGGPKKIIHQYLFDTEPWKKDTKAKEDAAEFTKSTPPEKAVD